MKFRLLCSAMFAGWFDAQLCVCGSVAAGQRRTLRILPLCSADLIHMVLLDGSLSTVLIPFTSHPIPVTKR